MATCVRRQFGVAIDLQMNRTQRTQERCPDTAPADQMHDSFVLISNGYYLSIVISLFYSSISIRELSVTSVSTSKFDSSNYIIQQHRSLLRLLLRDCGV